ncbi:MAG: 16S rRNA (cytosine(967)-C(5))-methyltransferase [Gammaproteobacteria bacterium]|nr:16S rRNA (cytosine(967)-C(5))-methyltransferase [Gammaproteobacteria bacterium]
MAGQNVDSPRADDAQVIAQVCKGLEQVVLKGRTFDWLRSRQSTALASPQHQDLMYGTVRHFLSLQQQISQYLAKPLRNKDHDLEMLLLVGAYQLEFSRRPAHAVVNNTVNACRPLGKPWARGLINGVLRKILRNVEPRATTTTNNPQWLIEKISQQYPNEAAALLHANDQRAPMVLRVNSSKISVVDYCAELRAQQIPFALSEPNAAIVLTTPQPAASLPGWADGQIAVQELSAQFPANIVLQNIPPHIDSPVLFDACCAPGGKLYQLHELLCKRYASHQLVGNDKSPSRLEETLKIGQRLGHSDDRKIVLQNLDATVPDATTRESFDVVIVDAPCSGSGTIRRNPDIRLLLQPEQIPEQQSLQLALLFNLWRGLKQGGTLLYSTCSVFDEENDLVIEQFVREHSDAHIQPLQLPLGAATKFGWQMLPSEPTTDGFYYALIHKAQM